MQLPDYALFPAFIDLRHKMEANKDGVFEIFDAVKHLTGEERSYLETGIWLDISQVKNLKDATLAYKNSRIMLYTPSTPKNYHLAECEFLGKLRASASQVFTSKNQQNKQLDINDFLSTIHVDEHIKTRVFVFTNLSETSPNPKKISSLKETKNEKSVSHFLTEESKLNICNQCLQRLHYKGFDIYQNRKFAYSEELAKKFTKAEFFQEYKIYPLTSKDTKNKQTNQT